MGMSVGVIPIGEIVITEREALPPITDVTCILSAEGGITLIIDGNSNEVQKVWDRDFH